MKESKTSLIPSFTIDHTRLMPGIYVSRQDDVNGTPVTTYDIRMTMPNREPAIGCGAMHTIEHLVATFLRNDSQWKDRIVYWGPMGCLTGCYLIMKGAFSPEELRPLIMEAYRYVAGFEGEVPGTTPATCGNCLLHDLPMAKYEASRYLKRLAEDFRCEYPGE